MECLDEDGNTFQPIRIRYTGYVIKILDESLIIFVEFDMIFPSELCLGRITIRRQLKGHLVR